MTTNTNSLSTEHSIILRDIVRVGVGKLHTRISRTPPLSVLGKDLQRGKLAATPAETEQEEKKPNRSRRVGSNIIKQLFRWLVKSPD